MSRAGIQSFFFENAPMVVARSSVVGKKESEGPLGGYFDVIMPDDLLGKDSWEQAESEMQIVCVSDALQRAGMEQAELNAVLAGDLNDQITASGFAARALGTPFIGLYGACSTFVQALMLAAALISGGQLDNAACVASSHFCTAERQFRFPLELGTQRPPSAHWTATAAGCAILTRAARPNSIRATAGTIGRVIDYNVTDANHMGAAMAPAVRDCIVAHFADTAREPSYYDIIVTGDLGYIGRDLLMELLEEARLKIEGERLVDCGASLFSKEQDAHAGGSGCGCVAAATCAWIMGRMEKREITRALVVGSGAMLSPTSAMQGQSIPSIAYAAALEVI